MRSRCIIAQNRDLSRWIYFLASLPIIEAVICAANEVFSSTVLGASLYQLYHGVLLVPFAGFLVRYRSRFGRRTRAVVALVVLFSLAMSLWIAKEYIETGELARASIAAYLRILFWLLLWPVALLACTDRRAGKLFLYGVALSAIFMSGSVFHGYATGQGQTYATDEIASSSGGYRSGKSVVGPILIGSIASLYFAQKRNSATYALFATAGAGATLLTFNRTGAACFVVVVMWLVLSMVRSDSGNWRTRRPAAIFLILTALLIGAYLHEYGLAGFVRRWENFEIRDVAAMGSGRGGLWLHAMKWWWEADLLDKLFGVGYEGMFGVNEATIHNHSDFFDLLVVGGALGILMWVAFFMVLFWQATTTLRDRNRTPEYVTYVALVLVLITQSLLTSAFFGIHMMMVTVLGITALEGGIQGTQVTSERVGLARRTEDWPAAQPLWGGVRYAQR